MRGTLTLLFTDIQGSTQMLDRLGDRYADLLGEHHRVMREAIAAAGGRDLESRSRERPRRDALELAAAGF